MQSVIILNVVLLSVMAPIIFGNKLECFDISLVAVEFEPSNILLEVECSTHYATAAGLDLGHLQP